MDKLTDDQLTKTVTDAEAAREEIDRRSRAAKGAAETSDWMRRGYAERAAKQQELRDRVSFGKKRTPAGE